MYCAVLLLDHRSLFSLTFTWLSFLRTDPLAIRLRLSQLLTIEAIIWWSQEGVGGMVVVTSHDSSDNLVVTGRGGLGGGG